MATANLVTLIQAAVTDLGTAATDIAGFIGLQEVASSTADPQTDASGGITATKVAQAQAALRAVNACQQLLDDARFQSGAALDSTVTIS